MNKLEEANISDSDVLWFLNYSWISNIDLALKFLAFAIAQIDGLAFVMAHVVYLDTISRVYLEYSQ